jgi:hypothetical protein
VGRTQGAQGKLEECKAWLRAEIESYAFGLSSGFVNRGRVAGYSRRTVYNAAKAIGVIARPIYGSKSTNSRWPTKVSEWSLD